MMKNHHNKNQSKAENIIINLINLSGVTIGIILLSIGSIMFLTSFFKLYVLGIERDTYSSSEYKCEIFNIDSIEARRLLGEDTGFTPIPKPSTSLIVKDVNLTDDEKDFLRDKYKECITKSETEDRNNFLRNEKINIARSVAFILVGLPLIIFYQRRRKNY